MGRTIALATPVFFALIALEYLWGRARGRNTYRLNDAINSLSLGVLSQLSGLYTRALRVGLPLLWNAANPAPALQAAGAGFVVLVLWTVGRLMQSPRVTSGRTSAATLRD